MSGDTVAARTLAAALALALGPAVSLGLARFSYALLLPAMRDDLGWSYFTAGAMNTVNAAGYLLGALLTPRWLARHDARVLLLGGCVATALLLAAHALVLADASLYALRFASGVASAAAFVSGGLLAARLAQHAGAVSPGLVLGLYYGGTGAGIVVSALLVPPLVRVDVPHAWRIAWWALAAAALACSLVAARPTRGLDAAPTGAAQRTPLRRTPLAFALAAYFMFGLGYIGYMTFVITLLREQRVAEGLIVAFYVLLGAGVIGSSWLWAGLLQRARGGHALALLNGLLALATALPVLIAHPAAAIVSGALFGSVFLSVVASTTALVRHNLPPTSWASGIAAFTIVFAVGQIVGPSLVGWLADGAGGLRAGFLWSAGALALGALLAARQKAL